MTELDPNKCLPPELTVQSVDDILFRIGLSLESVNGRQKQGLIHKPLFIFIFVIIFLIERLIAVSISEENELTFKLLGDTGYLIGIRLYLGIFFILCSTLILFSQLIYYYNYKNDIKPTFLRIFQMISGLISPKSIGLTDEQQIRQLVKITRIVDNFLRLNNKICSLLAFIFVPICYFANCTWLETLIYGVPNGVVLMLWVHYFWNIIGYQIMMFYIICLYFKLKINGLNESLLEMMKRKGFLRIRETLQSFDSLYKEINEYNTTFWSIILFTFWVILGSNTSIYLYIVLFGRMKIHILIINIYTLFIFILTFLFVIFTASSVNFCANKSYRILKLFIISYSQQNTSDYKRILTKFKVRGIFLVIEQFKLTNFTQILNLIGRVAKKNVGFTCWTLFTIDYYKCYEVSFPYLEIYRLQIFLN